MPRAWHVPVLFVCLLSLFGCAKAARDTAGFAQVESAVVDAPFEDAWQLTKQVLREQEYLIYTRDKRGLFLAFSGQKRRGWTPQRTRFTILLEEVSSSSTRVTVETVRQVYGVTLLTYPGWHDRRMEDNTAALEILEALRQKVEGPPPENA